MNAYQTISAPVCAEFVEKRSRFLAYLSPVSTREEAVEQIEVIKRKHRDATHHVPAYRLYHTGVEHCSDDGEPAGTAGQPTLSVLQNEELFDVSLVIVRYFGGVLLGGGGLVRAYSHAAALAVRAARRVLRCSCERLRLAVPYPLYGKLQFFLSSRALTPCSCDYGEQITVEVLVRAEFSERIQAELTELSGGRIGISSSGAIESDYPISSAEESAQV